MIGNFLKITLSFFLTATLPIGVVLPETDFEPSNSGEWLIEIVDSGIRVGDNSIAVDNNNVPHISYHDDSDTNLKYANRTGGKWTIEIVDRIGYSPYGQNSIALDSNGRPHISYHDQAIDSMKYASWTGDAWITEVVDSEGGGSNSLALDSNDFPHIVYTITSCLKYAKWTGRNWSIEVLGCPVEHISLALDSKDYPHVAYLSNYSLRYARWDGNSWRNEFVDYVLHLGASLALDSIDYPHIAVTVGIPEFPQIYYERWNGIEWRPHPVRTEGENGYPHLCVDSDDKPHIIYRRLEFPKGALEYAKWDNGTFTVETVELIGYYSRDTSLSLDMDDIPHLSYHDDSVDALKYATLRSEEPGRSISLDVDPDTLNLKSEGRWITAYLRTESASAEDINASSLLLNNVIQPEWWDIQDETTLMVKFNRTAVQAIVPVSLVVDIKITGQWRDGEYFELHDIIRVISPVEQGISIFSAETLQRFIWRNTETPFLSQHLSTREIASSGQVLTHKPHPKHLS